MPSVAISFEIDFTEQEHALLQNILESDGQSFEEVMNGISTAAFEEYIRMFVGQKVFTRGTDFKEYRLFLIIKQALNNRIPNEELVSNLFQLTSSESRSLVRSVMSKYQYELTEAIESSLKQTILNATPEQVGNAIESYSLDIKTESIVKELNRILGHIDGNLPQITKKQGTYSTHILKPSSYNRLVGFFHILEEQAG
jgi:hypothetical protein